MNTSTDKIGRMGWMARAAQVWLGMLAPSAAAPAARSMEDDEAQYWRAFCAMTSLHY